MIRRRFWFVLPVLIALPLIAAYAGGWAVITLEDLPDHLTTAKPVDLAFTIRQHGMTPMTGLKPTVSARSGLQVAKAEAWPAGKPGRYAARLAVPKDGDWRVTIDSDFGDSRITLLPIRAAAAPLAGNGNGGAKATPLPERGRRLFVAKGCITCHVHREVSGIRSIVVGPDLSERRFAAEYLSKYLADPSIRPPAGGNRMPDLDLDPAEIEARIAFINAERPRR